MSDFPQATEPPPPAPRRRSWRRRLFRVVLTLVLLYFSITGAVAWKLTRRTARIVERLPSIPGLVVEEHRLATSDGQEIGSWLFPSAERPVAVLFLHGNGSNRTRFLPLLQSINARGYPVLGVTLRAHGDSTGDTNDIGYSASRDVVAAVSFLRTRFPQHRIVVAGQSLGAAAAIFAARGNGTNVSGYFLEAPYLDLRRAVWNRCNRYLPRGASHLAYAGMWAWSDVFLPTKLDLIRPIDHTAEIPPSLPVTFITADRDRHCQLDEVQAHYERVRSHAKLVVLPSASHARLARTHPEQYMEALVELLHAVEAPPEAQTRPAS